MSRNIQLQKKKLIKEGSISAAIVLTLASLVSAAMYMESSRISEITLLQGQFNGYMSELSDLETKHELVKNSIEEFTGIKSEITSGFHSLDREKAREVLAEISKQARIDKVDLQMSPIETLSIPEATFQRADTQFSDVRLTFRAMTDMHVYAMIDALMKKLPGIIKMTGFEISKTTDFSNTVLLDMSKGDKPEMVTAEVSFLWMGIRLFALDPSGNPIPPPPPGAPVQ